MILLFLPFFAPSYAETTPLRGSLVIPNLRGLFRWLHFMAILGAFIETFVLAIRNAASLLMHVPKTETQTHRRWNVTNLGTTP